MKGEDIEDTDNDEEYDDTKEIEFPTNPNLPPDSLICHHRRMPSFHLRELEESSELLQYGKVGGAYRHSSSGNESIFQQ